MFKALITYDAQLKLRLPFNIKIHQIGDISCREGLFL